MQVVVQNTFLTINEEAPVLGDKPRSRSADWICMLGESLEKEPFHLERLNDLRTGPSTSEQAPKGELAGLSNFRRVKSSNAVSSLTAGSLFPKFGRVASSNSMCNMASFDSEQSDNADTSPPISSSGKDTSCSMGRVSSNSSVSTMATEGGMRRCSNSSSSVSTMASMVCEEDCSSEMPPTLQKLGLRHTSSSGSVSTLASFAELPEDTDVDFDMVTEEVPLACEAVPMCETEFAMNQAAQGMPSFGFFLQPVLFIQSPQMVNTVAYSEHSSRATPSFPPGTFVPKQEPVQANVEQEQQQQTKTHWLVSDYCHSHVPKSVNLAEEFAKQAQDVAFTTVMIRNIPNRYSQNDLIDEMEELGFAGTFDFLYVPLDKGTMSNVGYAFVNFLETASAKNCMSAFEGYRFKKHRKSSGKIGSVSIAHLQGLEANVRHYERAAVNTARLTQRRPVIMANISSSLTELSSQPC